MIPSERVLTFLYVWQVLTSKRGVRHKSQIFWDEEEVTLTKLGNLLANLKAQGNPPVIKIRADRELRYQEVIDVIDMIKQNKLTKISLDTQAR